MKSIEKEGVEGFTVLLFGRKNLELEGGLNFGTTFLCSSSRLIIRRKRNGANLKSRTHFHRALSANVLTCTVAVTCVHCISYLFFHFEVNSVPHTRRVTT